PNAEQQLGSGQASEELNDLSQQQHALNKEMERMLENLAEQGAEAPEALARALGAMEDAKDRLAAQRADRAAGPQGQAIESMQKGAQALADKLMEGRSGQGTAQGSPRKDPFGRPMRGPLDTNDVSVPDEIDTQRAQRILKELRERAMELGRPQIELDYLDRLLKRF